MMVFSLPLADDARLGREAISKGEVIACVLAGGEGTRLSSNGPKGQCQVGGKPLFDWMLEKVPEDQKLIVMTSEKNDGATRDHFSRSANVVFWKQPSRQYRDHKGQELPESGPNGNGALLEILDHHFLTPYKYMVVIPVDNPLADPYDAELIGAHIRGSYGVSLRCIERHAEEKVGVVTENGVIDYTQAKDLSIQHYPYGHTNLFCFDIRFLQEAPPLPVHWVEKKGVLKGETFLLDLIDHAKGFYALISKREKWFFPIKEPTDVISFATTDR